MAVSINTMAAKLEASSDKEQEFIQSLRELVSAVSHDLRTPLASIRVMVESLVDGVVDDRETADRYLRNTLSEVEYLGQLVDDLFEIARMDAGMLQLHIEDASIEDLISDTLESMSPQAVSEDLSLQGSVQGEISPVFMDTMRVQRVLYNLVQNAIRHTLPTGRSLSPPVTPVTRSNSKFRTTAMGCRSRIRSVSSTGPIGRTRPVRGRRAAPGWV